MHRNYLTAGSLGIALILLIATNLLAGVALRNSRVDLTADRLYTLTEGSRSILAGLSDDITLTFYFSDRLFQDVPSIKSYGLRVEELLNEYSNRAGGRIKLNVVDPEPFSEAEDQAVQYGIRGAPAGGAGESAYFGLAGVNTTDGEEVIPFFHPGNEDTLEYDVTRLIHNLDNPKKKVVAVISGLPLDGTMPGMQPRGQQPPAWMVLSQIQEVFDTRVLGRSEVDRIDDDVDVLMIVHPQNLSETTLFAIDQFVLGGGRVLAFVDPFADSEPLRPDPFMPNSPQPRAPSDLGPLLAAWGVEMDLTQFAGDRLRARKVGFSRDPNSPPVDFPPWLELRSEDLNQDDVITSGLSTLSMATVGIIRPIDGATTLLTPLIESSDQVMAYPVSEVQLEPDPKRMLNSFVPAGEKFLLAARITGPLKSAFPDGPPLDEDAEGELDSDRLEFLPESRGAANIILVADADILADRFWVQVQDFLGDRMAYPFADNGSFVINALDNLGGSSDLISVRSRASYARPFDRVREIQREAEERFRQTERELQARLLETDERLRALQKPAAEGGGEALLNAEQQQEIEQFLQEKVRIRKELRTVQRDLRKDIEALQSNVRFVNIGLVPLMIGLTAMLVVLIRARGRRARYAAA